MVPVEFRAGDPSCTTAPQFLPDGVPISGRVLPESLPEHAASLLDRSPRTGEKIPTIPVIIFPYAAEGYVEVFGEKIGQNAHTRARVSTEELTGHPIEAQIEYNGAKHTGTLVFQAE